MGCSSNMERLRRYRAGKAAAERPMLRRAKVSILGAFSYQVVRCNRAGQGRRKSPTSRIRDVFEVQTDLRGEKTKSRRRFPYSSWPYCFRFRSF